MTVRELILALQELPEEVQDSDVSGEYRVSRGELDVEGEACEVEFCAIRVDTVGRGKRKRHAVILHG